MPLLLVLDLFDTDLTALILFMLHLRRGHTEETDFMTPVSEDT